MAEPARSSAAPLLLAHRGDWRQHPENSLAALLAGARLPGCDGVEFDVRISSDGVPVVIHDATLARVQGRPGRVADLPAAELAAAGIPTLAEVLAALPPETFLDVELKGDDHGDATAAVLEAGRGGAPARAVVSSFEPATLDAMRARLPGWPRWLNADDLDLATRATARALGCVAIAAELKAITPEAMGHARAAGLAVAAWTARAAVETDRVATLGVVAICAEGPGLSRPPALGSDGAAPPQPRSGRTSGTTSGGTSQRSTPRP